jgi:hypothetical protein
VNDYFGINTHLIVMRLKEGQLRVAAERRTQLALRPEERVGAEPTGRLLSILVQAGHAMRRVLGAWRHRPATQSLPARPDAASGASTGERACSRAAAQDAPDRSAPSDDAAA